MLQPLGNVKSYFNWKPRLAAHYMMWFDRSSKSHLDVGYDSSDPAIVTGDLDLMQSMGVDLVTPDYYGTGNLFQLKVLDLLFAGCATRGMYIAPCFDGGIVKYRRDLAVSATSYMIGAMKAYRDRYKGSPAIEKLPDGRMLCLAFSWNSGDPRYDVDETAVAKAMPDFAILFREAQGFTKAGSAGAFAWVHTDHAKFCAANQSAPLKVGMGAIARGFDDHNRRPDGDPTQSCWGGPARITPERDGQFLLDGIAAYNASAFKPQYMQIATFNDYEEGTAVREGIDSNVQPQISYINGTIGIVVTGNKNAVDSLGVLFDGVGVSVKTKDCGAVALDQIITTAPDGQHEVIVRANPRPLFIPKGSNKVTAVTKAVTRLVWS
jgi:hypothetical protein